MTSPSIMDNASIAAYLILANQLAVAARGMAMQGFRHSAVCEYKGDGTPVTTVDREIENKLTEMIRACYPDHGIYGEEFGNNLDAEYLWVIDPIDGTKSFLCGKPTFGCLIALLHRQKPLLGIIEMPALEERWVGVRNQPTTFNSMPIQTSNVNDLHGLRLAATSLDLFSPEELNCFLSFKQLAGMTIYGCDCYAYALLTSGHIDLVLESDLSIYDYAPLIAVVEGAGGVISNWENEPLPIGKGKSSVIAAANRELHQLALDLLNRTRRGD